jgi:hypothetical protein
MFGGVILLSEGAFALVEPSKLRAQYTKTIIVLITSAVNKLNLTIRFIGFHVIYNIYIIYLKNKQEK